MNSDIIDHSKLQQIINRQSNLKVLYIITSNSLSINMKKDESFSINTYTWIEVY